MPLTAEQRKVLNFCTCRRKRFQTVHARVPNEKKMADESKKTVPGVEGIGEAIKHFELKTCLLLATSKVSMKTSSSTIEVLNLMDGPLTLYKNTKVASHTENNKTHLLMRVLQTKINDNHWNRFKRQNTKIWKNVI